MDDVRETLLVLNQYFHFGYSDIRDTAAALRDQHGFDLIPLRWNKRPIDDAWTTIETPSFNSLDFRMLGIRTGRRNDGLTILDIDMKKPNPVTGLSDSFVGFRQLQEKHPELQRIIQDFGWCIESTTGGWHFYFVGGPDWRSCGEPVELKCTGHQVVIPPSRFNGKPYRIMRIVGWHDHRPVLEPSGPDDAIGPLPDLPPAIYESVHQLKNPRARPLNPIRVSSTGLGRRFRDRRSAERAYDALLERVAMAGPGNRFNPVQSVVCSILEFANALPHRDPVHDIANAFTGDRDQLDDILGWATGKADLKMVQLNRVDPYAGALFAKLSKNNKKRNAA